MTPRQADADTHGAARYRRPVSPTERLYLAAGDARGDMALRIVVEGDGIPDRRHFQAALTQAAEACPGSRLVRAGAMWSAEGPVPRVRYEAPRAGTYADSAPGTVELPTAPWRRTEPPGCEVLIVPGGDGEPTTITFSASHAVMDGHGALTWVREVFRALRGEPARPAPDTDTDTDLLRHLGRTAHRPTPMPARRSPLGPANGGGRRLGSASGGLLDLASRDHLLGSARGGGLLGSASRGGLFGPANGGGHRLGPANGGGHRLGPANDGGHRLGSASDGGILGPANDGGLLGSASGGGILDSARGGGLLDPANDGSHRLGSADGGGGHLLGSAHGSGHLLGSANGGGHRLGPANANANGKGGGSRTPRTLWLRRTLPGRHPALTARLAQALTDATGLDTRVMIPVDLRRHRPGIAATGNLTLPLFLDLRPGTDWTAAHTRLLTALSQNRELAAGFETALAPLPLPVTAALLRTAQAAAFRTDRHLASAVVSHLGRLDLTEFTGGGFTPSTAYALPVHAPLVPLSLVATETGTTTELTLGVRGAGRDLAARAAKLLDTTLAGFRTGPEAEEDGALALPPEARPTTTTPLRPAPGTTPDGCSPSAHPADPDRPEPSGARATATPVPPVRLPPHGPAAPDTKAPRSTPQARAATAPAPAVAGPAGPEPAAARPADAGHDHPVGRPEPPGGSATTTPVLPKPLPAAGPVGAHAAATRPTPNAPQPNAPQPNTAAPDAPASGPAVPELTVVDAFRAQAARTPDAPALDGPEGMVSYAELDRSSDAVAAGLGRRGVGREDLVGLVVDRTPAGVCALWGILKAGAAYVPLDPGHPGPRIREILHGSATSLCLTNQHLAEKLAPFIPGALLTVEALLNDPAPVPSPAPGLAPGLAPAPDPGPAPASGRPGHAPRPVPHAHAHPHAHAEAGAHADAVRGAKPTTTADARPAAGDLAYVIHTSGSTGRPKGVQIEHGSLMGFVRWMTDVCQVTDRTRFGFASSYAFDISCFPLFLPLLAGGTAVLAPATPSPATLRDLVAEHRANTLALTPSHLALLGAASGGRASGGPAGNDPAGNGPALPLRTLLLGGEPLTPAAVRSAHAAFGPDCRVVNAYGPTEATVAVLAHTVDGTETGATVPIGLPGPYAQVDLVPEDVEDADEGETIGTAPADIGRTGEIVVRGVQVARGYLGPSDGRPSPFTTRPDGIRTYRTGDLGRRLPGGAVEFAGRIDDQVKIAGHRVEPAEVVAALEAHTAVHRAVVVPRRRPHSTASVLCAYVLPHADDPAAHDDPAARMELSRTLRTELTRTLAPHLVPAHVLVVDTLPRTASGKTDLDALPNPFARTTPPAPAPTPAPAPAPAPAPTTLEARVRHHWTEILGVDGALLSADSDFHALGGDSLALVEMLTAVSSDLLTPAQAQRFTGRLDRLVRNLTLEQLCGHLTAAAREEASA